MEGIRGLSGSVPEMGSVPVQFITGHTHYRGWTWKDDHASSFEAGHYLDTLGWITFDTYPDEKTWFNFEYVDANRDVLADFTGVPPSDFDTELGKSITEMIDQTVADLELAEVLGCPDKGYSYQAGLGTGEEMGGEGEKIESKWWKNSQKHTPNPPSLPPSDDSLYDLYMNTIVPSAVLDVPTGTGNLPYHISSTGTLRYDIYEGSFFYDDVFAIAPFANTFVYVEGLDGHHVEDVLNALTDGDKGTMKDER